MKPKRASTGRDYVLAGILAAILTMTFSYAVPMVSLGGDCSEGNARRCLWFLIIFGSAPIQCLCLSIALYLNQRRRRPLPEGWLSILLFCMVFTQISVTAFGVWLTSPYSLYSFFSDALLFPHGLVAGVVFGAIYALVLPVISRRNNGSA